MISSLHILHYVTEHSAMTLFSHWKLLSEGTFCSHSLSIFHRKHQSAPRANRMSLNAEELPKDRPGHLSHLRETSQLHFRPHHVGGKHQLQIRRQPVITIVLNHEPDLQPDSARWRDSIEVSELIAQYSRLKTASTVANNYFTHYCR